MLKKTLLLSLTLLINSACLAQANLPLPYSDFKMFDGYSRVEVQELALDQQNNYYVVPSYGAAGLFVTDSMFIDSVGSNDHLSVFKFSSQNKMLWHKPIAHFGQVQPVIQDIIEFTDTSLLISVDAMGTFIIDQDTLQFPSFSEVKRYGLLLELHKEDGRFLRHRVIRGHSISLLELNKVEHGQVVFFPSTIKYFLSNEDTIFLNMSTNAVYPLPLVNYDFVGDSMKWLKVIPTWAASIKDIAVTPTSSDIVIGGFFKNWIVFDQDTIRSQGFYENYFVALYDKNGKFKWAKTYDSGGHSQVQFIDANQDFIAVSGGFVGHTKFDDFQVIRNGQNTYYVAILNVKDGRTKWLQVTGESVDDISIANNSIYTLGRVGNGSFINGHLVKNIASARNISLVRRDLNGDLHWFGIHRGDYNASAWEMVINDNQEIHIGGWFQWDFPFQDSSYVCRGPYGGFILSLKDSLVTSLERDIEERSPSFQLAPNPSTALFELSSSDDLAIDQLSVFDISGRRILHQGFKEKTNAVSIDLSQFNNGVYLLKWKAHGESYSRKLVKVN